MHPHDAAPDPERNNPSEKSPDDFELVWDPPSTPVREGEGGESSALRTPEHSTDRGKKVLSTEEGDPGSTEAGWHEHGAEGGGGQETTQHPRPGLQR
jgi:hypothetical protein